MNHNRANRFQKSLMRFPLVLITGPSSCTFLTEELIPPFGQRERGGSGNMMRLISARSFGSEVYRSLAASERLVYVNAPSPSVMRRLGTAVAPYRFAVANLCQRYETKKFI